MESGKSLRKRKEKSRQESEADDSSENDIDDDVEKVDDDSSICSTSPSETVSRYSMVTLECINSYKLVNNKNLKVMNTGKPEWGCWQYC